MDSKVHYAICILRSDGGSNVTGVVKFVQPEGGKTIVNAYIKNLSKGKHGFHVHEFGNLLQGCKTAGAHYNPYNKTHGGPNDSERHIGDMGNIVSDGVNDSTLIYEDPVIQLAGPTSIIGRSVVVHADEDDLGRGGFEDSKTTGHAGARLACGVIGISGPFEHEKPKF
jgi:Cu/Zn superoxide dismutase